MTSRILQQTAPMAAIAIASLFFIQSALAKPAYIKNCSHVKTSVTVSGPAILTGQLKQQAMAQWQNQTGSNVNNAAQQQFSCVPGPQPKYVTCTFSARPCTIHKNTKLKPYPSRPFPKPEIAIGSGRLSMPGSMPQRMPGAGISGGPRMKRGR